MILPLPAASLPAPSDTLADWMGSVRFPDAKILREVWIEPTDPQYVRAWDTNRILFSHNPDMLNALSHSLSRLRLDDTDIRCLEVWDKSRLNPDDPPEVSSPVIWSFWLERRLVAMVNGVLSEYTLGPAQGDPVTPNWKTELRNVGPDFQLCTRNWSQSIPYPCPNICWVMPTTIPSFGPIAKIASRLAQEDGFGLSVLDGKTRLIGCLRSTSEAEEEQIRLFLTEVVDRMHSRGSSSLFITDGQRFLVVQRLPDLDDPKSFHFSLSTLIGNAGPLDLNTPSDDLSPAHQPNLLTELPVGLLCSLSFDTPLDPFPLPALSSSLLAVFPPDSNQNGQSRRESARLALPQDDSKPSQKHLEGSFFVDGSGQRGSPYIGRYSIHLSGDKEARPDILIHSYPLAIRDGNLIGPLDPESAALPCLTSFHSSTASGDGETGQPGPTVISNLQIHEPVGIGRLWDSFLATLEVAEDGLFEGMKIGQKVTVIAKITSPSSYSGYPRDFPQQAARDAVLNEYRLYSTRLKHLQGSVVPKCYGLWGGVFKAKSQWDIGRELWVMLMEYGGDAPEDVYDAFMGDDAPSVRRELLRQYERLHQANVLHHDIDPRHWLQRPGGGWMIIDFDGARELTGAQEDESEKEEEMRRVRFELPWLN
ncbi:hypothetical protein B9479_007446 [Cryptococcus floricola]|uniref:Protein kinase domain-containing protein n=1 Tax=Cryptococcus floricola TaxID=2591691 RepID=A0A5D3AK87_9TREE|nr:hypothetical protein B9479_007446 [Cryptococcus floricola]